MSFLFGGKDAKKKPKEIVREQQREVRKSERAMDREQLAMQRQEKQLIADIKKAAAVSSLPKLLFVLNSSFVGWHSTD